jgi:ketosteroid isomerase-like protein
MKFKIFLFLLLFLSVSVFAQTKDDEALKSLVNKMTAAQANYDAAALDKLLTLDYIEISPVGEFDSREKVLGFYQPELKPHAEKMTAMTEATDFSIRNYGKFAIVITRLNYTITSEGKPLPPRSMRVTLVCQNEKSVWKISSAQYTGIRSPQPAK